MAEPKPQRMTADEAQAMREAANKLGRAHSAMSTRLDAHDRAVADEDERVKALVRDTVKEHLDDLRKHFDDAIRKGYPTDAAVATWPASLTVRSPKPPFKAHSMGKPSTLHWPRLGKAGNRAYRNMPLAAAA